MEFFIFYAAIFLCTFAYYCHIVTKIKIEQGTFDNTDITTTETADNTITNEEKPYVHIFNNEKPRWIKPGEIITIAETKIIQGNFYLGNKLHSSCSKTMDAFLVDTNFNIEKTSKNHLDHTGKFLPNFSLLSPKCKGAFIDWLASDRTDTNIPILYPLIYFYGLEHRIIYDCKDKLVDNNEYCSIFTELQYLRQIFKKNIAFYSSLTKLMEVMVFKKPYLVSMPATNLALVKGSLFFNYELAKLAMSQDPLPYSMALAWLWQSDNYKFDQRIINNYNLFSEIFKLQYQKKFCDSLIIETSDAPLKLIYKSGVGVIHKIKLIKEILAAEKSNTTLQKIAFIANKCTEVLTL